MAVEYHPALEVGGDLYDFDWDAASGTLQVVIGDVSGKSIPAALYGAVFSGQLRTLFAHSMSPSANLLFLNANLIERYQVNNYVAVSWLTLNLAHGTGVIANGGMPFPLLSRNGEVTPLDISGVPLGLFEDAAYDQLPIHLLPGDVLVFMSDGTTDVANLQEEMYDMARFKESLRRHSTEDAPQLVKSLYGDISEFANNTEVKDDITIVAVKRRR